MRTNRKNVVKPLYLKNVAFAWFALLAISLGKISSVPVQSNGDSNCTSEQFTCHSGNGECVALNWLCDENPDCTDGSDELDCNGTCRGDEFTCANKHCIQHRWVCDLDDDCGDGSDEKNCSLRSCSSDDFQCAQSYCITSKWRCDGDSDCPDQSDEINCKVRGNSSFIHCTSKEFDCGDKIMCIHKSWVCDGDNDCSNNADESADRCSRSTCRSDQFQCADRSCISGHLYCNGKANCLDGSDEKNCTLPSRSCDPATEFECAKGSCIPLSSVCNDKPDCIGWEDENKLLCGRNECLLNGNGGCSQICVDQPIGYRCACKPGYALAWHDNKTCEDVNECLEPGACSQGCLNTKGSFRCSCVKGYSIDPSNHSRCKATEGHASLLFTRRHDIRKISLDRQEMTAIVNDTKMATALDFVFRTGMVFWSDVSERKIYKAPIDESNDRTVVVDKDMTISDGLAVDWIYSHIYWADAYKNTIELANFEGGMRKTLIKDYMEEPRALAVNPLEGWMFWTDWGDNARIERAGMDASHRSVIVDKDIKWPNGLTLDLVGRRIYWLDAKLNIIASCKYDGAERRTILYSTETLKHPFSVTTFEDHVYWTDWSKETIFKANKFTGENVEPVTTIRSLQHPMVVHIYHPYRQPDGINHCQAVNGHCSHLCLPSPRINAKSPLISCACPDGLYILDDGLTCAESQSPNESVQSQTNLIVKGLRGGTKFIFVAIASLSMCLLVMGVGGNLCYKHCSSQNATSMNFDNPVYRKTTEDKFSLQKNQLLIAVPLGSGDDAEDHPLTVPETTNYV